MRIFQIACCAAIVLVACAPANEAEPMACSSGFAPTGNALTFGSESSVELVKAIDAEWAKLDLGSMRQFYSDTCLFEWNDGDQFQGFDAFAAKLSGDTLDYSWNMIWAYCVDDDQEEPGDWVHAGFDEFGTFAGDTVEKVIIEEWYYIRDEKVQYYSNSKRPVR